MSDWVSIDERLPDHGGFVWLFGGDVACLVYFKSDGCHKLHDGILEWDDEGWNGEGRQIFDAETMARFTHWHEFTLTPPPMPSVELKGRRDE